MAYVNGKLYYLLPQGGSVVSAPAASSSSVNIGSSSIVMSATELLEGMK